MSSLRDVEMFASISTNMLSLQDILFFGFSLPICRPYGTLKCLLQSLPICCPYGTFYFLDFLYQYVVPTGRCNIRINLYQYVVPMGHFIFWIFSTDMSSLRDVTILNLFSFYFQHFTFHISLLTFHPPKAGKFFTSRNLFYQINNSATITPFIIIPADNFDKISLSHS